MSLETHSVARNRVYQRKFDHEECIRLRTERPKLWTYKKLAEHFGVSQAAIERVCKPQVRAKMDAQSKLHRERLRRPCIQCGKPGVWAHTKGRTGLCSRCAGARIADPNVRETELRCTRCGEWKPDEEFPKATAGKGLARRGHRTFCRACATEVRREFRHRKPEQENATAHRYYEQVRREKRGVKMEYVVLKREDNGAGPVWRELERVEAPSPDAAVEKAVIEEGEYVAVVSTRWDVVPVKPIMSLRVLRA
jgi:hypothetical protein